MSDNFAELLRNRLQTLESQRKAALSEFEKTLAPIDAAIAEVKYMLSKLNGEAVTAPVMDNISAVPMRQDATVVEVVRSPKTGTPILTNSAMLRKALGKGI